MTVVITGDRIAEIGETAKVPIPKVAQVVDGKGKFLIPGLWDMHAHPFLIPHILSPELFFNMCLANGVTGLRDPSGPLDLQLKWKRAIQGGKQLGPRMFVAGPIVDGPIPMWPTMAIAVANPAEARSAVVSLKKRGADFIKVYDLVSREAYFAIVDEARKENIPMAGHIPISVTAAEASDAGQRSIEHVIHLFESCSSLEAELQTEALRAVSEAISKGKDADRSPLFQALLRIEVKAVRTFDETKAQELFARFVKNGTYVDPTLIAYTSDRGDYDLTDPRLRSVPAFLKETWKPGNFILSKAYTPEDIMDAKMLFHKRVELVAAMRRAGVKLLAGTDAPTVAYTFAGFSVHDELGLFVQAGLTPMEALQTATRNPAEFLGILSSLGTVEKGKIADLALLDANPLENIGNTRKIAAVVIGGRILPKIELLKMLAAVERAIRGR
jgi:imidazolonepropionase-like amidohydrolase